MQSNVKSRLIEFLKFKSISQKAFAQSVGVSAGFVNAIRVSIQPKTLEKISNVYPNLNITWLLTGVGPMLLDVAPPAQVSSVNSAVAMHGNAINIITNESDTRREKLAGYFFDLSKLTFAALVVGCFTSVNDTVVINGWVLAVGSALTIVFAVIASIIIKK